MKEPICIIKLLDYEAQTAKHKKSFKMRTMSSKRKL